MDESYSLLDFIYDDLAVGEIRLLIPNDRGDGLDWTLQTVSLSAEVEYDALSYTWGSQAEQFPMICNGKRLHVHHNLYTALPFLARRTQDCRPRPIWIDAVCINQGDEKEKGSQIAQMNELYRGAQMVWIWLGVCADQKHIPTAISLLPKIITENERREQLPKSQQRHREADVPLQNLHPGVWRAVRHIVRNPWFERTWIIQEAALAKRVLFVCGQHEIEFDLMEQVLESDELTDWAIYDEDGARVVFPRSEFGLATSCYIRGLVQDRNNAVDSPYLLLRTAILLAGSHECFLPQDRVFGMLGLVPKEDIVRAGYDLNSSVSIPELYRSFTRFVLLNVDPNVRKHWWRYFNLSYTFKRRDGLCSWVPELHYQANYGGDEVCTTRRSIAHFCKPGNSFQASSRPVHVRTGIEPDELVLRGKILDTVVVMHPVVPRLPDGTSEGATEYFIRLTEWEDLIAKSVLQSMFDGADGSVDVVRISDNTYWRTLLANEPEDRREGFTATEETWRTFRTRMRDVVEVLVKEQERIKAGIPQDEREKLMSKEDVAAIEHVKPGTPTCIFMARLAELNDRQLFNTEKGRFGFVIRKVRPGDLICVFNGSTSTHVIRKVDGERRDVYRLVGDAYVHDLMEGEADKIDVEEKDIVLI